MRHFWTITEIPLDLAGRNIDINIPPTPNRTRNAIKRDIRYLMPRVLLVEIVGVSAAEESS